ncbi:MAG: adenosylcobalamin-dependent ribonucleoside-diphosphate reductase [Thermodesulfobacteriota bacterium]
MDRAAFPKQIKKRDGSLVPFDSEKIEQAVQGAAYEVLQNKDRAALVAQRVADRVLEKVGERYDKKVPSVESIQDLVEDSLMSEGYSHIARAYILYREERSEIRTAKEVLGLKDDLKLPLNTMEVLKRRYLLRDDQGRVIETPSELFRRVAFHVAQAEHNYKTSYSSEQVEERFYRMMRILEFLPNSPTLMNAGTPLGQLSACFVIPVGDSIDEIFRALRDMAKIHQSGGGTGFSFSSLRPKGDLVSTTKGRASGPVSFMEIFDEATGVIMQGGRRRGANMGILRCDHPDIIDFIEAKEEKDKFSNFNLSVGVSDDFMEAIRKDKLFPLINPRTGKETRKVKARAVLDLIVNAAWRTGDPGLIFLDEINRRNPTPLVGRIKATNPCGELPLLDYESCNLGSINVSAMAGNGQVDWEKLKELIGWAIRFLDDVVEVNRYPLPEIGEITLANRKVGLGVMGFADMLIKLGIAYRSKEAVEFAEKLMGFIHKESLNASMALAEERGVFPNFDKSIYAQDTFRLRNATVNTIAPTGTISILAGCSSGIEPLFAISYMRNVLSGTKLFEVHPIFEKLARERGIYKQEILSQVAQQGSVQKIKGIPRDMKRVFTTAFDLTPGQHLEIQAAFQNHTDNSVSKTINLPKDATVEDVRRIYLRAHQLRCKGITIYRYGSKEEQVLSFDYREQNKSERGGEFIMADSDYSGGCATGTCPF